MLLFLWDKLLGMKSLGEMIITCLTFYETAQMFSKVTVPFCTIASNVWGFQFLHIFFNT